MALIQIIFTDTEYQYHVLILTSGILLIPILTPIGPRGIFNDTDIELIHTNIDYPFQHQYATDTDREREKERERKKEKETERLKDLD